MFGHREYSQQDLKENKLNRFPRMSRVISQTPILVYIFILFVFTLYIHTLFSRCTIQTESNQCMHVCWPIWQIGPKWTKRRRKKLLLITKWKFITQNFCPNEIWSHFSFRSISNSLTLSVLFFFLIVTIS